MKTCIYESDDEEDDKEEEDEDDIPALKWSEITGL